MGTAEEVAASSAANVALLYDVPPRSFLTCRPCSYAIVVHSEEVFWGSGVIPSIKPHNSGRSSVALGAYRVVEEDPGL